MAENFSTFSYVVPKLEEKNLPEITMDCPDVDNNMLLEQTPNRKKSSMDEKLTTFSSVVPKLEEKDSPESTMHSPDVDNSMLFEQTPNRRESSVKNSPGGTLNSPDVEKRVLGRASPDDKKQTPKGRKSKARKGKTTPKNAGCSRPKRTRLSLRVDDDGLVIRRDILNSNTDDGSNDDSSGDEFENFMAMRLEAQRMREEACEEDLDVEGRVHERGEGIMGVNGSERLQGGDAELRAMPPEFVNLNWFSDFTWSKDFSAFAGKEETYSRTPGPSVATQDPVDAFIAVWDEEIMNEIVRQTNKYAWDMFAPLTEVEAPIPEPLASWTDVSTDELYEYFGILILMSVCNRTVVSDYWTTDIMGMPGFRRLMSRNRFLLITRMLHFVDNNTCSPSLSSYEKKIFKINPILDHCNERFASLYTPCKHLSLDESLLRFGIKSYELSDAVSGYLLRILIYAGKDSHMLNKSIPGFENCTVRTVLQLMDGFLDVGHTLVMDNWYNQLPLTRFLKRRGTDVIGTINSRGVHVPKDIKEADPKVIVRGEQIARHCGDISLIAWKDSKLVTVVSTYHNDSQVPSSNFSKPAAVADYNRYMGGVAYKDQQLSTFLMERKRGRKWYMKVFKRLLNISLLNTLIIFRKNSSAGKPVTHGEFRKRVAKGLFERFSKKNLHVIFEQNITEEIPGIPCRLMPGDHNFRAKHYRRDPWDSLSANARQNITEEIPGIPCRLMPGDHFVDYTELSVNKKSGRQHKQRQCVRCRLAGQCKMVIQMCTFCDVALCFGRCWAEYHTLEKL